MKEVARKRTDGSPRSVRRSGSFPNKNGTRTRDENDKTDPSDKLQHKMNLVSNYFTK
jgi:hypothetical protein